MGPTDRVAGFRSPVEEDAGRVMHDLGNFMRDRFARYVAALRGFAEEAGMGGVPFVVNVHGTEMGRGLSFPIGISQLYEAYTRAPGYVAGTDHYLGDVTAATVSDLYLINAFMDAVNLPEQPLTSVEFEAGDGDYGGSREVRLDPSAADFKLRISVAQGNRLINFYLFAGGANPRLDVPVGDGNDRISFTGERHGTAAPVGPEGQLSTTYPRLARTVRSLMAVADSLAVADEERDPVALGFIPDAYMTESVYPGSAVMAGIVENLTVNRGGGPGQALARALLLSSYRFGAVDVQNRPLDPAGPVLALSSARYMDGALQAKLADYVESGGRLLLVGELPLFDMEGVPCVVLADSLGLRPLGSYQSTPHFFLSATADSWAATRPEVRVDRAQTFEATRGADVIWRVYGANEGCGFDVRLGAGRAIVVTADLPCDLDFFRSALGQLGAAPSLAHGCPDNGIFQTSAITPTGERFVHVLNLDGFDKPVRLTDGGRDLLPGWELILGRRDGLMLPFNVVVGPARIVRSTAEVAVANDDSLTFRLTQRVDLIALESERSVLPSDDYEIEGGKGSWMVRSRQPACDWGEGDFLTVRFT